MRRAPTRPTPSSPSRSVPPTDPACGTSRGSTYQPSLTHKIAERNTAIGPNLPEALGATQTTSRHTVSMRVIDPPTRSARTAPAGDPERDTCGTKANAVGRIRLEQARRQQVRAEALEACPGPSAKEHDVSLREPGQTFDHESEGHVPRCDAPQVLEIAGVWAAQERWRQRQVRTDQRGHLWIASFPHGCDGGEGKVIQRDDQRTLGKGPEPAI